MSSREDEPTGMTPSKLDAMAAQTQGRAKSGDVFAYFIAQRRWGTLGRRRR